jgi:uncharacterized protein (TIGR00297 family)
VTWLTARGAVAALLVGAAELWGLGWRGAALLVAFFVSGSVLTRVATGWGGRRNARQVLANGGIAALAALCGSWVVSAGALAAATADTWATEIGAFSPYPPRFITTGARVARGASGGITLLGTLGGIAGALVIALLAHVLSPRGTRPRAAFVLVAGISGMFADSVVGATAQGLYECAACGARSERGDLVCHEPVRLIRGWQWLDNDAVNLVATLVGASVSLAGSRLAS